MSQAQISNFSSQFRPIIRSQTFNLPFHTQINETKEVLVNAARSIPSIRKNPAPKVYVSSTTESWINYRLVYHIDDYGMQFRIADEINSLAVIKLKEAGIELAGKKIIVKGSTTP